MVDLEWQGLGRCLNRNMVCLADMVVGYVRNMSSQLAWGTHMGMVYMLSISIIGSILMLNYTLLFTFVVSNLSLIFKTWAVISLH